VNYIIKEVYTVFRIVPELRAENEELKQLAAELSLRNRKLKKTLRGLE
jgi:hypothetical protein